MDQMARDSFKRRLEKERTTEPTAGPEHAAAQPAQPEAAAGQPQAERAGESGFMLLPIIELCRCSPGLVTAMGVSVGLAAGTIMSRGTIAQKERWALDLLTFEKVGAWAITESDSGSDAFGRMQSTAKRDGEEYVLNGSKTFITNGPYADTTVFICKLDEGNRPEDRKILSFVLDRGMDGFEQSKPMRKMGMHSSPTGPPSWWHASSLLVRPRAPPTPNRSAIVTTRSPGSSTSRWPARSSARASPRCHSG
jgi:alkylation response protein AidB-like acyl-CoA dehydrogenase